MPSLKSDRFPKCDPNEVALKSFFLGPQAENASWMVQLVQTLFSRWADWRRSLFPEDGCAISERDKVTPEFVERKEKFEKVALNLLKRFESEVPKFSPRYAGHMFSEISLPALVGHLITLLHNPNNISGESSKVGIKLENEAIQSLLRMAGFSIESGTGHFTSGGTIANFEAMTRAHARSSLWLALGAALSAHDREKKFDPFQAAHMGWEKYDELLIESNRLGIQTDRINAFNFEISNPHLVYKKIEELTQREFLGPVVLVPENKHYSWKKAVRFLGMGDESLWSIDLDREGKLAVSSLKALVAKARVAGRPILLVVSVVGTTELGSIDPVDEVQDYLDEFGRKERITIWHHLDAAFGGFFRTLNLDDSLMSEKACKALIAFPRSCSVTLDPHKLGYVPYASGAFLAKNRRDYYFKAYSDAPYIDFNEKVDRGAYTIEGSRSAGGAVATWMTAETMGLDQQGYGLLLERTIRIRKDLEKRLQCSGLPLKLAPGCDTNVLCFSCARPYESLSTINQRTLKVYENFSSQKGGAFIVSKTHLRWKSYGEYLDEWTNEWSAGIDCDEIVLIRMCLMNPFFESQEMGTNFSESFLQSLSDVLRRC